MLEHKITNNIGINKNYFSPFVLSHLAALASGDK
jgi:hypothetical protein